MAPPPSLPESAPSQPLSSIAAPALPQNLEQFVHEPALKDVLFDPDRASSAMAPAS